MVKMNVQLKILLLNVTFLVLTLVLRVRAHTLSLVASH